MLHIEKRTVQDNTKLAQARYTRLMVLHIESNKKDNNGWCETLGLVS